LSQLRWFLAQEVAGEAGFEDLLSVTQVKMPVRAKLEMARNFWDEMGRGQEAGMHGLMLGRLSRALGLEPAIETTVPESLALGNMMVALAFNRRYAFQSIGAMGAIELTAPTRAVHVVAALRRLGVSRRDSHYFALHAAIDLRHSAAWNAEVISSLVSEERARIRPIAEGALLRLWCGLGCFKRYRAEFGLST
jgi:pyrroloquinoline quinone (PQQ) biosynthesis protein C